MASIYFTNNMGNSVMQEKTENLKIFKLQYKYD